LVAGLSLKSNLAKEARFDLKGSPLERAVWANVP
jgi:hypothetical protein